MARLTALGATVPPRQPHPDRWRVLPGPAGHPFRLTLRRTPTRVSGGRAVRS
ncbi:VOC family protein [Streptomyces thermolilacinus]|uniref:VOC family protein n=1 Tax=Streptomyces thermolilacinus TaxID=285540 RepID=UPI001912B592|nr:VOC family protein [Streptomyces thermolilacinus]